MKKNRRQLYVSLSNTGYCLYATQNDSWADYLGYEQQAIKKYNLRSRRAYIDHLCKRYCPNPVYPGRLKLAFQKLEQIKSLAGQVNQSKTG